MQMLDERVKTRRWEPTERNVLCQASVQGMDVCPAGLYPNVASQQLIRPINAVKMGLLVRIKMIVFGGVRYINPLLCNYP